MKLSDGEKLILVMLSELYEKLGVDGEIDPGFVREAIYSGNLWGLKWEHSGIFDIEDKSQEVVEEVVDILDMWTFMERAYDKFTPEERARLEKEAKPFGDDVKFKGFDGNNECEHRSVALFLINRLDRFGEFKGQDLNSHYPSIEIYRRMLTAFHPIRRQLSTRSMNADDVIVLMNARTHPEFVEA